MGKRKEAKKEKNGHKIQMGDTLHFTPFEGLMNGLKTGLIELGKQQREHQQLVKTCKQYISDKHCTLWMDWIVTEGSGLERAAEWLATQIEAVSDLTREQTRDTLFKSVLD